MVDGDDAPWPTTASRLRIGDIELDLRYRTLHRAGVEHELTLRAFELLLLFLREPRILHTRESVLSRLWVGVAVEDANLTSAIWTLRRAFGVEAKHWIRTVSRQGYVFDPPPGVRTVVCATEDILPVALAAETTAAPKPAHETASASLQPPRWRYRAAAVCAILFVLAVGISLWHSQQRSTARGVPVVVSTGTEANRWPLVLLHEWISWQLPAAAPCTGCSESALLLSIDMPTRQDGEWQVAARFRGSRSAPDIVLRCPIERLVPTIDQVSRSVLMALDPTIDPAGLPVLALDDAAAGDLADGLQAEQQHRWGDAVEAYGRVAERQPAFGFALVRLGASLAVLGQRTAADRALKRADAWTQALPATLAAAVRAQQSFVDQDYQAAAAAYANLQQTGGDNADFRIREADSLLRSGRSRDAAQRLAGSLPPAALAVRWLLLRAQVGIANRELAQAAIDAKEAKALAQRLGWNHDHAQALLLQAETSSISGETVDAALFDQAVQDFRSAGDEIGALRARALGEFLGTAGASTASTGKNVELLLAAARMAGNVDIELETLRRGAAFRRKVGDIEAAHALLAQATIVAETARNLYERSRIDVTLLQEDVLHLDLPAVDRRLARLRAEPAQGITAYIVGMNAAQMYYLRGNYPATIAMLAETESELRNMDTGNLDQLASGLGCIRAHAHMAQGAISVARNDLRDCRAAGVPAFGHLADIVEAELSIHMGDPGHARKLLLPMHEQLATEKDLVARWALFVDMAPLVARLGDLDTARQQIDEILPAVARSGYRVIETNLRNTRAEVALAQGQVDRAEQEATLNEAMLPADLWYEQRRLRTIKILISRARGRHDEALALMSALHTDARQHNDVLAELLVHSLLDKQETFPDCSEDRYVRLLASSGMRAASDQWMSTAAPVDAGALVRTTP